MVVNLFKKYGGEDRARTCKRLLAVVFKTTALPIRLPLRILRNLRIYRSSQEISNVIDLLVSKECYQLQRLLLFLLILKLNRHLNQ